MASNGGAFDCLDENHFPVPAHCPAMQSLKRVITETAPTDIHLLLVGEGGTGKEVVALEIRKLSRRQNEPFIKMSCAGLTASAWSEWLDDIQSSDRTNRPLGLGTLFLDEISELDPACQSKLLVAPANRRPSSERHCLDVHVIFATSRDLEQEMRAHRFRQELYYCMNAVSLRLPSLRQPKEHILGLVDYVLAKYAALCGLPQPSLSSQTLQVLLDHS